MATISQCWCLEVTCQNEEISNMYHKFSLKIFIIINITNKNIHNIFQFFVWLFQIKYCLLVLLYFASFKVKASIGTYYCSVYKNMFLYRKLYELI
ncbi:unnamed protein product [Callosobruchus maculatus]|uniref:Uncharacterized protein n=1 Tax=Callosobruchus maculatus TaxID=64391 RepID=A0A653C4Q4_CALMS|nr:unnamed protein product [Callosobruchus maculatus]